MRYRAVLCMMKLANVRVFDKKIAGRTFESMCMAMQVSHTPRCTLRADEAGCMLGCPKSTFTQVGRDPSRAEAISEVEHITYTGRSRPRKRDRGSREIILPPVMDIADTTGKAKSIVNSVVRQCTTFSTDQRIDRVELPMARLLLVLSRHPDIADEWDVEGMKNMAR